MNTRRFDSGVSQYVAFRPKYPDSLLARLAERIGGVDAPADSPVVDVGSGTGIFTRQLRAILPAHTPIIGIEPAENMRRAAQAESGDGISYRDGSAESLPVPRGSGRAIVAATAAHWFDRPAFYASAAEALAKNGLLAIIEYVRDGESPAARAVVDFLNAHGEPRAYARPDYIAELQSIPRFRSMEAHFERRTLWLEIPQFAGLALSSSHAKRAIESLGRDKAEAQVSCIGKSLTDASGQIPFGYIFQMFIVA